MFNLIVFLWFIQFCNILYDWLSNLILAVEFVLENILLGGTVRQTCDAHTPNEPS